MIVNDRLYGNFEISDPLALELIALPSFERLKRVSQLGLPQKCYPSRQGFSRFEHCVGVYLLLMELGAAREEQIAGLIHDISHTAFSHVIDWVVGADVRHESYQDNNHLSVLRKPEITAVLAKYGFTSERMADYHGFGLLERDIPDLCADRIDYSLRQMDGNEVKRYLASMTTHEGEIVFADRDNARGFADDFLDLQIGCWASYDAATRYVILADLLKRAMKNGDIDFGDFMTDDDRVLAKINAAGRPEYRDTLALLEGADLSSLPKASEPQLRKFRYVDPKIISGSGTVRLSEIDDDFKNRLEKARADNAKGVYIGMPKPGIAAT